MEWVKTVDLSDRPLKVPIKSWCTDVEPNATIQAMALANHPAIFKHVALMPDCHSGYGMPIGGVAAFQNAIVPNAVGVDIGCGMTSFQTGIPARHVTEKHLLDFVDEIQIRVPMGIHHQKKPKYWKGLGEIPPVQIITEQLQSAIYQLGTLGGGNHFIEVQINQDGIIFFMVHSGSRNIGYKVANYYYKLADRWCNMFHSPITLGQNGLGFLPEGTLEGQEYIEAMKFCLAFAKENRKLIMEQVLHAFYQIIGKSSIVPYNRFIDVHHNFARKEHHFGRNVWVHRKGATPAFMNETCIIPGSMGTKSFILKGKGNGDSFMSCSHGAGRKMGRGEFTRSTTKEACDKEMEGIVFSGWSKFGRGKHMRGLDFSEAPSAYKDINEVITAQEDLVEVIHTLEPIAVVKD